MTRKNTRGPEGILNQDLSIFVKKWIPKRLRRSAKRGHREAKRDIQSLMDFRRNYIDYLETYH